jgi:hypothetical protein
MGDRSSRPGTHFAKGRVELGESLNNLINWTMYSPASPQNRSFFNGGPPFSRGWGPWDRAVHQQGRAPVDRVLDLVGGRDTGRWGGELSEETAYS